MTEEEYWYWLVNIDGMWHGKIKKILDKTGTPRELYNSSDNILKSIKCINEKDIHNIKESKKSSNVLNQLSLLSEKNIKFIYLTHKNFPERLKNICDAPYALFVKGRLPENEKPAAAIIGTRLCTNYGKSIAQKLAGELSGYGVNIISGLAKGIDSAAHRGTVNSGGHTYAVLGNGVDICYPRENIDLFCQCIESGGIISEYPLGTKPVPWQFPYRNRIISGLSDIIIVVEAKEKSGSFITVEAALEQGRDVYAVPGRIGDVMSSGCNKLIKSGAGIVTEAADVLLGLGISNVTNKENSLKNKFALEKDLQVVYSCFDLLPKGLEQISAETGYDIRDLMQIIVKLQLMDLISEPIKNHYAKKI